MARERRGVDGGGPRRRTRPHGPRCLVHGLGWFTRSLRRLRVGCSDASGSDRARSDRADPTTYGGTSPAAFLHLFGIEHEDHPAQYRIPLADVWGDVVSGGVWQRSWVLAGGADDRDRQSRGTRYRDINECARFDGVDHY